MSQESASNNQMVLRKQLNIVEVITSLEMEKEEAQCNCAVLSYNGQCAREKSGMSAG